MGIVAQLLVNQGRKAKFSVKLNIFFCPPSTSVLLAPPIFAALIYPCVMMNYARSLFKKYKWPARLLLFLLIWVMAHVVYISIDGLRNEVQPADVAIVLGNRVFADGSLANWTKGRVDRALELYQEGKVKKIFVSGGLGLEDQYPEGKAMKEYLVKMGVPDSAVVADDGGANSYLTAVNFLEWNKSQGYKKAVIVSQFYHITRCKYILRKRGFEGDIQSASSRVYNIMDVVGTLREVPAFYKYLLVY